MNLWQNCREIMIYNELVFLYFFNCVCVCVEPEIGTEFFSLRKPTKNTRKNQEILIPSPTIKKKNKTELNTRMKCLFE